MRRRFILYKDQLPKLVKLTSNPGIDQNYMIENGYRYFDLLVVGGGGAGGSNHDGEDAAGGDEHAACLMGWLVDKVCGAYHTFKKEEEKNGKED